ncbi:MAG: hypothetical protein DRO04_01795 [Candidatus Iainarchaeum archaeon]|uniref:Uncharacterized protein n=1 Tax=Candidatus Iainarchaeum sp. TaxID=3101447 RepID=A0A497JHI0_9ARCH|nr:MAG: hypothetical protein DRO04_01795 [Candidatus Diapherotrites archaeon]
MAKRRRSRTRTRTVVRTVRRSLISNSLIAGAVGGAIASIIPDDALFGFGDGLGVFAVGHLMKNKTLQTLGAFMIGAKLIPAFSGIFGRKGSSPSSFL